jgi:DnaJ-domain-containing protein 1
MSTTSRFLECWLGFVSAGFLAGLVQLTAQPASPAPAPEFLPVRTGVGVVNQWQATQHLYVKGNIGVGLEQLNRLEYWLDHNATNWTVVLLEHAGQEVYRDTAGDVFTGMDAVEHALGKGLPSQTAFGQLIDARTQERNGAFFILFLKERKFSYYGSDAQDRCSLGEEQWAGNLDRPAVAAMRGSGRIVDAVKDTIVSINRQLDQRIVLGQPQRAKHEANAKAERVDMINQASAVLENSTNELNLLKDKIGGKKYRYVEILGKGFVSFPDEMSQDQIADVLRKHPPFQTNTNVPSVDQPPSKRGSMTSWIISEHLILYFMLIIITATMLICSIWLTKPLLARFAILRKKLLLVYDEKRKQQKDKKEEWRKEQQHHEQDKQQWQRERTQWQWQVKKAKDDAQRAQEEADRQTEIMRKLAEQLKQANSEGKPQVRKDEQYYRNVLGLNANFTRDDVRRKYRNLATKYHPDRVNHLGDKLKETAEREMKEINEAFDFFKNKYSF